MCVQNMQIFHKSTLFFIIKGNAIINYEKIETQISHGEHNISSFSASRDQLKKLFDLKKKFETLAKGIDD